MEFKYKWTCTMDVVTLFLILVSKITITELGLDDTLKTILSRLQKWVTLLSLSLQFSWWKEYQLEKVSANLELEENFMLSKSNVGKMPLR